MTMTETIVFIGCVLILALAPMFIRIVIQAAACDGCSYNDVCESNSGNKEFVPPCQQNIDINNNNFNAI